MIGVSEETLVHLGNHRALPINMLHDQLHNEVYSFVDPKIHNNISLVKSDEVIDLQTELEE